MMLLPITFFVLVAVPGQVIPNVFGSCQFGWPFVHCLQVEDVGPYVDRDYIPETELENFRAAPPQRNIDTQFWSSGRSWAYSKPNWTRHWNSASLLANIAIAFFTTVLIGALIEFRRRRVQKLFQISILQVLILMGCVGAGVAGYQSVVRQARLESAIRDELENSGEFWTASNIKNVTFGRKRISPVWLGRLLDNRRFISVERIDRFGNPTGKFSRADYRVCQVSFIHPIPTSPVFGAEKLADRLGQFEFLESVQFWPVNDLHVKVLDSLDPRNIRSMSLSTFPAKQIDFSFLTRFELLTRLELRNLDFEKCDLRKVILPNLVRLETDADFASEAMFEWIRRQPHLKTVRFFFTSSNIDMNTLERVKSELPGLTLLDIENREF